MNHQQALELSAVDSYLLNELPSQLREDFEEHFFGCQECSTDLRATSAFMDAARKEFKLHPLAESGTAKAIGPRLVAFWKPAVLTFALAASLLVVAYQNIVVLPGFRNEIAESHAPQLLPTVSLIGANSRGGATPAAAVAGASQFLLVVDIPTQDRFSSYDCMLYSPSGALLWTEAVSAETAKDTVHIAAPAGSYPAGAYSVVIQGKTGQAAAGQPVEVARYHFNLSAQR